MKRLYRITLFQLLFLVYISGLGIGQVILQDTNPNMVEVKEHPSPQITVLQPQGKVIRTDSVRIEGIVEKFQGIVRVRLEGGAETFLPVDWAGRFSTKLLFSRSGINRLIIEAGGTRKVVELEYKPEVESSSSLSRDLRSAVVKVIKKDAVRVNTVEALQETISVSQRAPKTSRIFSPTEGEAVEKVVKVRGVADRLSGPVWLQIGEVRQSVKIHPDGSFEEVVIFKGGENRILLGTGSDTLDVVKVYSQAPRTSLRIQLTWDADQADVDLYVAQPNRNVVWFGHMSSGLGFLDVDDTNGYGPEHYTLNDPISGTFRIYVHYYATHGYSNPVTYHVNVIKNDKLFQQYDGVLSVASNGEAGPLKMGRGESWRQVAEVTLP